MPLKLQIGDRRFRDRRRETDTHVQRDGLFAREQMESCRILSGICIVYRFIGIAIGDGDFMVTAISSAPVSTPHLPHCCCWWSKLWEKNKNIIIIIIIIVMGKAASALPSHTPGAILRVYCGVWRDVQRSFLYTSRCAYSLVRQYHRLVGSVYSLSRKLGLQAQICRCDSVAAACFRFHVDGSLAPSSIKSAHRIGGESSLLASVRQTLGFDG